MLHQRQASVPVQVVDRTILTLAMQCPICHQHVSWEGNPYRPFCSERCKLIDLDHWLAERYRISTPVESRDKNVPAEDTGQGDKRRSG
jgi:hypothetical protein